MKPGANTILAALAGAILGATAVYLVASHQARAEQLPAHPQPEAKDGGVVVELCDGVTKMEVPGLKQGHSMSHEQALAVTRQLMDEWERKHPGARWTMAAEEEEKKEPAAKASMTAHQASGVPDTGKEKQFKTQQGDTYASFNERDFKIWQAETDKFVREGKEIFHDSKKLGSTIGVSCDMCHPDAANTHPETYPKYQVQLQRVALLRDMIDWCIENPVKAKAFDPNDERLRALEAYILAQREGVALSYGKH